MKLFNAITAASVIGCSFCMVTPVQASHYVDLAKGKEIVVNDGIPQLVMTKGGEEVVSLSSPVWAMPISSNAKHTFVVNEFQPSELMNKYSNYFEKFDEDPEKVSREGYTSFDEVLSELKRTGRLPGQSNQITDYNTGSKQRASAYSTRSPLVGEAAKNANELHKRNQQLEMAADKDEARRIHKANLNNGCPPGTKRYRTKGLFGLGARDIGCMTAYEAESLRRQQFANTQRKVEMNRPRTCYGTANTFGNTTYGSATCY